MLELKGVKFDLFAGVYIMFGHAKYLFVLYVGKHGEMHVFISKLIDECPIDDWNANILLFVHVMYAIS